MAKYNWKDNYGFNESISTITWLSVMGNRNVAVNATSRDNPKYSNGATGTTSGNVVVFSSGVHIGSVIIADQSTIYGQDAKDTILKKSYASTAGNGALTFRNLTLYSLNAICNYYNCIVNANFPSFGQRGCYNCKIYGNIQASPGWGYGNSVIRGIVDMAYGNTSTMLYDNCNISISAQTQVNLSTTVYAAFNNCKFKIGSESDYTSLSGTTSTELRTSFFARCVAAGYSVPSITEYGETLQAGRWIFSNNSTVDGLVLKGSEIHAFETPRLIYFGYSSERNDTVSITTDKTKANSFSPAYADSALDVVDGSIGLKSTTDVSQKQNLAIKSNIIWLGGKSQINLIDIIHNLPKEYGVWLDNTLTLADNPATTIEAGKTYYLRSSNSGMASIVYNSGTYTSALANANNVFVGVSGVTSFTDTNGNAQVFEVIDAKALHQTIQMRIVDSIPASQITSGALTVSTWYLVEHANDQSNTTEYVTYNGSKYYVGSSFLVASGTTSFTPSSANVHLRECWADGYTYGSNLFYTGKQQPVWFDVLPNDPRCLLKYNNSLESEMQRGADGNYIASGHPDFYDSILGLTGTKLPAYQIKGVYMQLRLVVTTQNPM